MPDQTIENKKILLTNRQAVVIVGFVISATFAATTFYHQSRIQDLVTSANKERIDALVQKIDKLEDDAKARAAMLQAEMNAKEVIVKAYTDNLVKQEVGGLRTDWMRKNQEQKDLDARQQKEIDDNKNLFFDQFSKK